MKNLKCKESCGLNYDEEEKICCFYCKNRDNCRVICIQFKKNGLNEKIANKCINE